MEELCERFMCASTASEYTACSQELSQFSLAFAKFEKKSKVVEVALSAGYMTKSDFKYYLKSAKIISDLGPCLHHTQSQKNERLRNG